MQDNYVGDIGDYGKYGLLRAIVSQKLELAVNWYKVWPKKLFEKGIKRRTACNKQNDGKYVSYLDKPEQYRYYDPELFDCLVNLVKTERSIEKLETSNILKAQFFSEPLTGAQRPEWHKRALLATAGADVVFLDPDNGLQTPSMYQRGYARDKHATWQEVKDYYRRGQSVVLYQHRPQMMKKENCIQKVLAFERSFLQAESTLLLEYPRYTNRYYFIFAHQVHQPVLQKVYHSVAQTWKRMCSPIDFCRLPGDQ